MHRFYCPQPHYSTSKLILTDNEEIHHARDVLRLKPGEKIICFNGQGEEAEGVIESINNKKIIVEILSTHIRSHRGPRIILACAIPKRSKFEWIIEKTTELGVSEIYPIETERSEIHLDEKRQVLKTRRYQLVALNAAKQCQRSTIPEIHSSIDFKKLLSHFHGGQNIKMLIPSLMGERVNIFQALSSFKTPKTIAIFIGPEGDFTEKEYAYASQMGCIAVTLGETILKVETAAITAVACANIFFEKKGPADET
jgi:16S rRNA (uracil1498-N3)-methyltransferase